MTVFGNLESNLKKKNHNHQDNSKTCPIIAMHVISQCVAISCHPCAYHVQRLYLEK